MLKFFCRNWWTWEATKPRQLLICLTVFIKILILFVTYINYKEKYSDFFVVNFLGLNVITLEHFFFFFR